MQDANLDNSEARADLGYDPSVSEKGLQKIISDLIRRSISVGELIKES